MDFIRDCVSWPEWWLFALAAPCVVALLIIAITEIKNDRYWRAWIPLWMYDLPVPTPREIGGETSGSYEGNSTLSGSRTKTADTRSRRKRHSKARNMRTSEKKKRKAKRKRRTRAFSPGRKPAMRKSGPEIPNSTPMSARTPSGGGRSA